ncbi:hypothetical protein HDU84_007084 [Entophlyctis sp. JEL0112]|nr:hypothetical protein HDU84_007084 [Entophlyctis sp. JEL0112]
MRRFLCPKVIRWPLPTSAGVLWRTGFGDLQECEVARCHLAADRDADSGFIAYLSLSPLFTGPALSVAHFQKVPKIHLCTSAPVSSSSDSSTKRDILPASLVPSHYNLRLIPDLESFTFEGTVAIDRWEVIYPKFETGLGILLGHVCNLSFGYSVGDEVVPEIEAWVSGEGLDETAVAKRKKEVGQMGRLVDQTLESVKSKTELVARERDNLAAYFAR